MFLYRVLLKKFAFSLVIVQNHSFCCALSVIVLFVLHVLIYRYVVCCGFNVIYIV